MIRNAIQVCLCVAAIIALYLPIREYFVNRTVTAELDKLTYFLGDFKVHDPKKVYIRALETNEHLRYAWRVYFPENTDYVKSFSISGIGGGGGGVGSAISSHGRPARQFVLHMKVDITPDRIQIGLWGGDRGGSRWSSIQDRDHRLQGLLNPKWTMVKQLGKGETVEVEVDQELVLLELGNESYSTLASARIIPVAMEIMTPEEMQAMTAEEKKSRMLKNFGRFKEGRLKDYTRASDTGTP